jgi:hypothetical protein
MCLYIKCEVLLQTVESVLDFPYVIPYQKADNTTENVHKHNFPMLVIYGSACTQCIMIGHVPRMQKWTMVITKAGFQISLNTKVKWNNVLLRS